MNTVKRKAFTTAPICIVSIMLAGAFFPTSASDEKSTTRSEEDPRLKFLHEIPCYPGNVILCRPTDKSVTASILMNRETKAIVEHASVTGGAKRRSAEIQLKEGEPRVLLLDGLEPNTQYRYRIIAAETERQIMPPDGEYSFHTARPPGSKFSFTIQADSHLDGLCLPELYLKSLANVAAAKPDFHIDLGDTFMAGKIPARNEAARQYLAQRYYLGLVGHSAPLFLVLGNHDGEDAAKKGAREADGTAVWACSIRKKYFPNPEPDSFYSGNAEMNPCIGMLQDYYAWTWGDALFVVLDPYWHSSSTKGDSAPWSITLGKTQYDWLADLLRNSLAKFKFVFIHQLLGGLDKSGRGGAEATGLYEWGGYEKDGSMSFSSKRPGWSKPIHELLVENRVSAVFHGHDHFYADQEKDGIKYILVPQAANRNVKRHQAEEYGYRDGYFQSNSGILQVCVDPESWDYRYIRSNLD